MEVEDDTAHRPLRDAIRLREDLEAGLLHGRETSIPTDLAHTPDLDLRGCDHGHSHLGLVVDLRREGIEDVEIAHLHLLGEEEGGGELEVLAIAVIAIEVEAGVEEDTGGEGSVSSIGYFWPR